MLWLFSCNGPKAAANLPVRFLPLKEPAMFKVNAYFDGKVKSLGFQGESSAATVGVMAAGEYEFGTGSPVS